MNKIQSVIQYLKENKNKQINPKELMLDHYEAFLAIPLFAFILTPVYQLFSNLLLDRDYPFNGFYTYAYTVDYAIWLALIAGAFAVVLYFVRLKKDGLRPKISENIPMIFFAGVCLCIIISTCINGFTPEALHGDQYRNESIFSFLAYFLPFYFCGSLIRGEGKKRAVLYTYLVSNLIINLACLYHQFIKPLEIWEYSDADAPSAIFYQFNHYGYFLMLAIIISATLFVVEKSLKYRLFCCFMLALNTFILSMHTTFGCFLACLAGLVFLLVADSIINKRISIPAMAMLALFIAVIYVAGLKYHSFLGELKLFFTDIKSVMGSLGEKVVTVNENEVEISAADSAGTGRWGLWKNTISYIRERPLFGWGIEGIADRLETDSHGLNNRPHNEYLQYAAFFGIPAAIMYICGMVAVFICAWRKRKNIGRYTFASLAVAFTYLFSAVFGNTMFYTTPFLFIFLGLGLAKNDKSH